MNDKIKLLHQATTALWLELPESVARDFTDIQQVAIEELQARVKKLEGALVPFTHPDLRLRLGGNSPSDGADAIVFQRNKAILRLRDFDTAAAATKREGET